jgi:hypothetical protein
MGRTDKLAEPVKRGLTADEVIGEMRQLISGAH